VRQASIGESSVINVRLHDKHGTVPVGCRGSVDVNCLEASARLSAGAGCQARQP